MGEGRTSFLQKPLAGKVALITGAAGGIGREVARMLAAAGALESICDIQSGPLEELAQNLKDMGCRMVVRPVDVTDSASVQQWVDDTVAQLGPIDILVNVAGLWRPKPFEDLTAEDFWQTMNANLLSGQVDDHQDALRGLPARWR